MPFLTILTPTYNRRDRLPALFQSLQNQAYSNFEWLIVDDGSTDNTQEYIEGLRETAMFPVRYVKKQNGGKHTALNVGVRMTDTPLTIIVDSDDILLPNATELIAVYYQKYSGRKEIGAFTFLKCDQSGKPIVPLDQEEYVDSYIQCRIRENRPGDMAEVFYTSVLKECPFAEFEGERFLSEDVVWIQIGLKYYFVFINLAIYQCEYIVGGLTANDKLIKFASPLGSMLRGKMLMKKECGIKTRLKGAIIYNFYKTNTNGVLPKEVMLETFFDKAMVIATSVLGKYFYHKWHNDRRKIC